MPQDFGPLQGVKPLHGPQQAQSKRFQEMFRDIRKTLCPRIVVDYMWTMDGKFVYLKTNKSYQKHNKQFKLLTNLVSEGHGCRPEASFLVCQILI